MVVPGLSVTLWSFIQVCLCAVLMGGILGLEREAKGKPAGLKTHILIALGAAAFGFSSTIFSFWGDPSRIAAQVVVGISFIGAGTILQSRHMVHGLTTAATLWLAAAIGLMNGLGLFVYAAVLTMISSAIFLGVQFFQRPSGQSLPYTASIEILDVDALPMLDDMLNSLNIQPSQKQLERHEKIILNLSYRTTPLVQHLFLKKLFSIDSIGTIIRA